jgi:hypothetical protein
MFPQPTKMPPSQAVFVAEHGEGRGGRAAAGGHGFSHADEEPKNFGL